MGQISDIRNPWRQLLLGQPAKFRDVQFHVESGSRQSGRRTVLHEYPKRNEPYAEDMGVHARRFAISGYLIYRVQPPPGQAPYTIQRVRLIEALEKEDIGTLFHPVLCAGGMQVMCERYSMTESRERGGYTQFDMQFVQSGSPGNSLAQTDTVGRLISISGIAENSSINATNVAINESRKLAGIITQQAIPTFIPNTAERKVIDLLKSALAIVG